MFKYIVGVLILITCVLLWMTFGIGVPYIYTPDIPKQLAIHTYDEPDVDFDNPTRSISEIHIYAVHFIAADAGAYAFRTPQNVEKILLKQQSAFISALDQLKLFHELQLQGRSRITYSIYPKAVIGRYDTSKYETPAKNVDDFEAIASISSTLASTAEEIEERVFSSSGDLYDPSFFQKIEDDVYSVMLILYEGSGDSVTAKIAAADTFYNHTPEKDKEFAEFTGLPELVSRTADVELVDSGMLLSTSFFVDDVYVYGKTILTHEFYHTIGLPDGYDYNILDELNRTNLSLTPDIMGLGRFQSLDKTYLDHDMLINMGF